MLEADEIQLLREFAERRSDAAFAALVQRHVNLVYSVAMRQAGNPHAAEEITQAVFIILARKAASLGPKTVLSGWLYQTARLTAANHRRTEFRRARREQEAYMQSVLNEPQSAADDVWMQIAPLLDDALGTLGERDRQAIVLRFFENKTLAEVGAALGASEDAAKMRVSRALEKLRKKFVKRGAMLSAAAIAGAVSANSIQAAPMQLEVSVTTAGLGKAVVSTSVAILLKATLQQLLWLKVRTVLVVGLGVSLIGVGLTLQTSGFSSSKTVRVPASRGNIGQRVAAGPAVIRIKLLGTPGLPFELRHSANGPVQTTNGVLPNEVSFNADAFSATINVQGPGEFGFEIYRGDLQQASASVGPITNNRSIVIDAKKGGSGISMSGKGN